MALFRLLLKNAFRHRLRTLLTVAGVAVAILAFGLLRTVIGAWYAGVEQAPPDRLVSRNKISITFPLPLAQKSRIEGIPGVLAVTHGTWFGGIYKDPKNFFAQIAMEGPESFALYPEIVVDQAVLEAFGKEPQAAIVGSALAARFGWKVGDVIPLQGTIYPGDWSFNIRGIYTGRTETTDVGTLYFPWNAIEQRLLKEWPDRAGHVGWWTIKIDDPAKAASISQAVDKAFANSSDETLTETEAAFQQSFVAMSGTIILSLKVISVLIIGVILLVAANTMAMTARERVSEYAVLKTLGFGGKRVFFLIAGESILIAAMGGALGLLLLLPTVRAVGAMLRAYFPAFPTDPTTFAWGALAAIVVGIVAAVFPFWRAMRLPIALGLRRID
ncbi:MAG TPA: FtsX-like permease family protein [Candidatus Eisenbacteria bacterium]|nr:FtsX-like permease family protein [Candidatus Eisenbacteria bacterium]